MWMFFPFRFFLLERLMGLMGDNRDNMLYNSKFRLCDRCHTACTGQNGPTSICMPQGRLALQLASAIDQRGSTLPLPLPAATLGSNAGLRRVIYSE